MEHEIEELNRIYISELNKFLSVIDFEHLDKVKETIIDSICNYFDNGFKNLISYDKNVISEKIEEVFSYGVSRSRATIDEIGFIKYNSIDNFDKTNEHNNEQRSQLITKFDSLNKSNNFSDLEERISTLITDYLARRNYDNQNYEKYHFTIKSTILKYILGQKKNMLDSIKFDLEKKNQEIEKIILTEYKNIVSISNTRIDKSEYDNLSLPSILDQPNNAFNPLEPFLTDSNTINNPLEPILDTEKSNSDSITLPGNFLK